MGAEAQEVYFNPWDESFRANPYPHYRPLLAGPPRIIDGLMPMVLVARYADVTAVLRDHQHFSSVQPRTPLFQRRRDVFGDTPTVLFSDPPEHTRLRRLVAPAFTARRIRDLETRIRAIAERLLARAEQRGQFEVMADLANPLPVMVIAEMLGVPADDYEKFKAWSDIVIDGDNTLPPAPFPDSVRHALGAIVEYFQAEVKKRRECPGDDLVSVLIAAHEESDQLSEAELMAFIVILLLAGNETTTNLIGNGMLALGENPGQLELLRARPELMAGAIEEMLRYDSPAQSAVRFVNAGAEVAGVPVREGSFAFVILAAANRDPAQFPHPDRFDIRRQPNEHLAFSAGIHYCIGAALARLQASIAIAGVLARFPRLRLAAPDGARLYKGSYFLRGLAELPMAIG
ncbi:MAG TPA: cytochrome P450 [Candidatus Binataceae bacterium]|nr:cytochrome P450 [Candidatus Binataceae bacterium]